MVRIGFEKLSRYERKGEFVETALPFPQGTLKDASGLLIVDGDTRIRPQTTVTARWPDASVKWLHLSFLADLPGNTGKDYFLSRDGAPNAVLPAVRAGSGNRTINTGVLEAVLAQKGSGRLFDSLRLVTGAAFTGDEIEGPVLSSGGTDYTIKLENDWQLREEGPYRVIVENSGRHYDRQGKGLFAFTVKLIFTAGHPWFGIEYRFSHREESPILPLESLVLRMRKHDPDADVSIAFSNYQTTLIRNKAGKGVEKRIDADYLLYDANEQVPETLYGTFFVDWRTAGRGICATVFQAHQNFPKALRADGEGITVSLMPRGEKAKEIYQGVEKTHCIYLHLHDGGADIKDLVVRSLQIQMPDRPIPDVSAFKAAGVLEQVFMDKPVPRLEAHIRARADKTGRAYGMLHWGDAVDMSYTDQGRGHGKPVWTNGEYDYSHANMLMYVRTGKRRFLDKLLVSARHWMDVDICHYSKDPLLMNAQIVHCADHVKGYPVAPSHEWVEGLLDYYHLTADQRAYESALAIGENVLRHLDTPEFHQKGEISARETGWALRTFSALYVETGDGKWLEKCEWIVGHFVEWKEEFGLWLAPYTDHTVVRVPFMISIAVSSLMRYYRIRPSETIRSMILDAMKDLLENTRGEDGLFYYKELPSLQMAVNTSLPLEALAYAWELSGDKEYLRGGLELLRSVLDGKDDQSRTVESKQLIDDAVVSINEGTKRFAQSHVTVAVYLRALEAAGMLDEL
jgi:hypothetical protein